MLSLRCERSMGMLRSDTEYYRQRADAERLLAASAPRQDIAEIHEELARQYDELVANPKLRGMRLVG
jgi:hypothetical protein